MTSNADKPVTDKKILRREAMARRMDLAANATVAGEAAARLFFDAFAWGRSDRVAAYWPLHGEIDPRPIMTGLIERGAVVALPVTGDRSQPLKFRQWTPDTELAPSVFELMVPPENAAEITPNRLIVPLLAFDRRGHRIGFGAGYYDRTLAALRRAEPALSAVGLAFSAQEIDAVPDEAFDEPLDAVVTEEAVIYCAGPGQ